MLTNSHNRPIALPLHNPLQTTQPLPRMHNLTHNQHPLPNRHRSNIGNIQRSRYACEGPEAWLSDRTEGGGGAEVEDGGYAAPVEVA
jgi:hypothetical protein